MNLKTTLVLLILAVAGGVFYVFGPTLGPVLDLSDQSAASADAGTPQILADELTADKLQRIEIGQGEQKVVLERGAGGDWSLPGKWPTRKPEVAQLIARLTTELHSRFAPIPLSDPPDLKPYGLDKPVVAVQATAGGKDYRLAFGVSDDPDTGSRFSRPTFLRLSTREGDDWKAKPEVIRLAPGLAAAINRPADYFQQRRLFPSERLAKSGDSKERTETLTARAVSAASKDITYKLKKVDDQWQFAQPFQDHVDPERLKALLVAVPDIWAEKFIGGPKKDLAEYGLKEPERTLAVTSPAGDTVTLLIGKKSREDERTVNRPAPPGAPFPSMPEKIKETYHYAKLKDNDQIFEIKVEKLNKDVFIALESLRDTRLARFKPDDARKIEIKQGDNQIVLVKDKERWRLQKPLEADAEGKPVDDLLSKLANLEARGPDIKDKADLKEYQLEPAAGSIAVTVEEQKGEGDKKEKKTRTLVFNLGKHDKEQKKIYVQLAGWQRVNALDDDLTKLTDRPALAYRGRGVFDFVESDLDQIEVHRADKEIYILKRVMGDWRLTVPVDVPADHKAVDLAQDLSRVSAVEYVNDKASAEQLDKEYGLAKPELTVTLTFKDKDKPALTLLIGKQRAGKQDYFAKVDGEKTPAVFVVGKNIHDDLERSSLAYRPQQLWQVPPNDVAALGIHKQGEPEYRLVREPDKKWKIAGPFEAPVADKQVLPLLNNLATLRCERYESHAAKDKELETFGLDKPYLRLAVTEKAKEEKKEDKKDEKKEDKKEGDKPVKDKVVLIGKEAGKNGERYAKLADSDAIFVVGGKFAGAFEGSALDLLDRDLLTLARKEIKRIKSSNGDTPMTIEAKGDAWQVEAGAVKFTADPAALAGLLTACSQLRAERYAAYGDKLDLAKYGLDKPSFIVTVTVQPDDKDAKPVDYTVAVGKPAEGAQGARYARRSDQPGVAILDTSTAAELGRTYLDFVERTLLKLDASAVTSLVRKVNGQELELVKKDDGWQIVKPAETKADTQIVDNLVNDLARLRAQTIAAYPAKDLKAFGLVEPAAVLVLRVTEGEGKTSEKVIKIGHEVNSDPKAARPQDRYAIVEGSEAVGTLPGALVDRLLAAPIKFRDRAIAKFADADKALLERGPRKATFALVDGTWKLTEPLQADAEQSDLEEFVNALARLRADELVEEKPADLKPYGLDKPECRWRFLAGDKEVLALVIGNREMTKDGEGKRCYAQLAGGDLVFLLSPALSKRVLDEYRSRTLWAALDALQIERLDYRYANKPFALEKVDNVWQLAGKPDVKINQSAVNNALAALAGLKVERTVVDKDPDLKLFGLEPPQLVLEVQTRTGGKRVLAIGRSEGESKRSYAQVVGGNRGDVFIISEADGAKIVRDLAAFTQAAKEEKPKEKD
jgi:hypothetical protein